ncbi:MAG: hypothetical protein OXE53_19935 [Deltaproteobacteria bacterium]|nr:hypothetical protein [Deltaproteobacteria bacterium]
MARRRAAGAPVGLDPTGAGFDSPVAVYPAKPSSRGSGDGGIMFWMRKKVAVMVLWLVLLASCSIPLPAAALGVW